MKIAVILVNYNGKRYNTACIESVLSSHDSYEKRIIVVDNASQDGSMQILEAQFGNRKNIEFLYLGGNYGFATANNAGIRRACETGADCVLLLNNDTEIDSYMIEYMAECAGRHPGSVIIPKIYYSGDKERIWSAGGSVSKVVRKVRHEGLDERDLGQYDTEKEMEFATGCCLWLPVSVVKRVGMLDERFFLYYEDTEYSFRLMKYGIKIYYCPEACMYHKVGASSKGAESPLCAYYIARNWLLCSRLHLNGRYPLFLLYYVINRTVCCGVWLLQRRTDLVRATVRGISDCRKGRLGRSEYYL